MKRAVKNFLILSGILGAVGAVLVLASVFMGAHFSDLWNGKLPVTQFRINGNTVGFSFGPADSNSYSKSNSYSVSAEGIDAIQIDWVAGEVVIKIGETDQITFSEYGVDLTERTALRYGVQGSTLGIRYCDDQNFINVNLPAKQLTVIVPTSLATNLRKISVGSVSADVTIDDPTFRMENMDFESVSGNLNAVLDSAGKMAMETVSGNISVSATVNEFEAESGSGNVSVSGAVNKFEAESVSGDLVLDCRAGAPNELDVDSTSGDVEFRLPQSADLSLEYHTVSGDFDSARAMNIYGESYTIGNGRGDWDVETISGDLIIK